MDLDNDGLTNLQESQHDTNPNNPDSDGDDFNDGIEVAQGTDPNDPNSFPAGVNETPTAIPTLSIWSLGVFILILMLFVAYATRWRRTR